ncbi:beta-lactamase domain-containing protein 2-like [Anneissia japonica]|uniref:beta-lactamase domain-containing protein 2-like n=1 Tax=Anneissia japonica TaxID=1529436 RepID=UPI00142566DF|nr:beta-lactamase domain-containing protein 2-like [Anneissia japonica]
MLVDRGLLSYDEKVVKYWPEFGKHGKENVTVKMLVSHQAAIPFPNETLTWDIFRDHEKLAGVLADSVPQWEIGTGHGYHTMTMASFCSVLVYKVDPKRRTLGQFVHDELYVPFGIDIHFGLPKELFHRVARMEEPKYTASQWVELVRNPLLRAFFLGSLRGEESIWNKVIRNMGELSDPYRLNDPDNRMVEVPSAFGTATADGLARLYGILANGGDLNRTKLLSKAAINTLKTSVIKGMDKVVMKENEWGPGTLISDIKIGKAFGHSGAGGQEGWANPELKIGYGFVTNTPTVSLSENGQRYLLLRKSLYDCVQNLKK